jgi:hypothetical protein
MQSVSLVKLGMKIAAGIDESIPRIEERTI